MDVPVWGQMPAYPSSGTYQSGKASLCLASCRLPGLYRPANWRYPLHLDSSRHRSLLPTPEPTCLRNACAVASARRVSSPLIKSTCILMHLIATSRHASPSPPPLDTTTTTNNNAVAGTNSKNEHRPMSPPTPMQPTAASTG